MIHLTRRYRFSASHRLDNPAWPPDRNRQVYGRCNNPFGHGHDYVLDVTVKGQVDPETGLSVDLGALDRLVEERVLRPFDRRDLNTQAPEFAGVPPTSENLAGVIDSRLKAAWDTAFPDRHVSLARVKIEETRRNSVELE